MKRIFTKNFIILALVMFLGATAFMLLMPILPIFSMEVVKLEESRIGLVVGAFSVSALLCRPFVGYLLDNFNRRILFIAAMACFAAVLISYNFITTLLMLMIIRMIHGVSWATVTTGASTVVVEIIPEQRRAEGIGLFSMAMPMAMVIGPAVGLELYNHTENFGIVFAISSALGICAFVLTFFLKLSNKPINKRPLILSFPALYEKRALGTAFMQYCYSFSYSGIITFLPLFAHTHNIENSGMFFILYAVSVLLSRVVVRKTFDMRGPDSLIFVGYLLFALGALTLSFTHGPLAFFISGILAGFGAGMVMPTINTMTMNVVEANFRGKANATVMTALDLGMGSGALVMGYLVQHTSYAMTYIFAAIVLCVPIVWYFARERRYYYTNVEKLRQELASQ